MLVVQILNCDEDWMVESGVNCAVELQVVGSNSVNDSV